MLSGLANALPISCEPAAELRPRWYTNVPAAGSSASSACSAGLSALIDIRVSLEPFHLDLDTLRAVPYPGVSFPVRRIEPTPEKWVLGMGEECYRGYEVVPVEVLRSIVSPSEGNDCLGHHKPVLFAAIELPAERIKIQDLVGRNTCGRACGRAHRGPANHWRFTPQLGGKDDDEASRNKCPASGWVGVHLPPPNFVFSCSFAPPGVFRKHWRAAYVWQACRLPIASPQAISRCCQLRTRCQREVRRAALLSKPLMAARIAPTAGGPAHWTALSQKTAPPALVAAKVPQAAPISRPPA